GAVAVVASTLLIALVCRKQGARSAAVAAALFGWNPLVQVELGGNGHNDSVLVAGLLLGLYLLSRRHSASGSLAVAVSAFVKYLTVVAVPFFVLFQLRDRSQTARERMATVARSVGLMLLATAIAFAPLWFGPTTLSRVREVDNN